MVGAIMYIDRYMCSVEDKYIHGLAPLNLPSIMGGQRTSTGGFSLRLRCLSMAVLKCSASLNPLSRLPIYFRHLPSVWVFNISENGLNPLDIAQALAGLDTLKN